MSPDQQPEEATKEKSLQDFKREPETSLDVKEFISDIYIEDEENPVLISFLRKFIEYSPNSYFDNPRLLIGKK